MRRLCQNLAAICALFYLTGCFARHMGFQPAVAPEITSAVTGNLLATGWLDRYHKTLASFVCPDGKTAVPDNGVCPSKVVYSQYLQSNRNTYIDAIRFKIDQNYSNFKSSVYSGNAVFGMASDWAVIGLSGAAAVVEDAGLKSILSVASGGVTGSTASYQKQVLNQQNALAIVSAMDAARASDVVHITESELLDTDKYTIESALVDLRHYYDDGTMLGGLLYIQGQMGNKSQTAQEQTQTVKNCQAPITGMSTQQTSQQQQSSQSSQQQPCPPASPQQPGKNTAPAAPAPAVPAAPAPAAPAPATPAPGPTAQIPQLVQPPPTMWQAARVSDEYSFSNNSYI